MWTVIVDSTALVADFKFRSVPMSGLIERVRAGKLRLVVPEIVVREAVARYGRFVEEASAEAGKLVGRLGRLGLDIPVPSLDRVVERNRYEAWLRGQLNDLGAVVPEPEETPHLDVVDRALAGRAPFSGDGKRGYRDALIWETVLAVARRAFVVLLSANSSDFAESNDEVSLVAPALRADLFRIGEADDRVLVCRSPAAVVQHLFVRDEQLLASLQARGGVDPAGLVVMLDPVLPIEPHRDLGLPAEAQLIGVTDFEAVERDEYAEPAVEVLNAFHGDSDLAYIHLRLPVLGRVAFTVPDDDAVDLREGVLCSFELDPGMADGIRFGSALRELLVLGIASFDTNARRFVGFTPTRLSARSASLRPCKAHLLGLRVGDAVEHVTFGRGRVVAVEGEGTTTEAEIEFDGLGRRRLLLAHAPLDRADWPRSWPS
jgi:hypothetical protein